MRLIDADAFEVISLQGKSEEFCNGVMWMLEQLDKAPTIPAIKLTGIEKHVSKFDFDDDRPPIKLTGIEKHVSKFEFDDDRPQCCIDHNKWYSVCDTCEFGDINKS